MVVGGSRKSFPLKMGEIIYGYMLRGRTQQREKI